MGKMPEQIGGPELLVKQLVGVTQLHVNISQDVIITTEDKIRICRDKHLRKAERKQNWIAPAGILLAVIATLVTASFQEFIFKAEIWKSLFILVAVAAFIWLLFALKHAFKPSSSDEIISELKSNSVQGVTEKDKS